MTIYTPGLDDDNQQLLTKLDEFIATSPHGVLLQAPAWARVKNNWQADYVYQTDTAGQITAAMLLLSIVEPDGSVFMYAPRGPVCDATDIAQVQSLLAEASQVAKTRNAFVLRFDPETPYSEELLAKYRACGYVVRSREETNLQLFSNPRYNMILNLKNQTIDTVMAGFSSRFRGKIRKSYRSGITTSIYDAADRQLPQMLDVFYELTVVMANRQQIKHRPWDYFARLLTSFSDAKLFITSSAEGVPLSGCILLCYNRKAFYIYAASSNELRNLYPSVQTNYEAIKYALDAGMHEYDMGGLLRLDPEDGLYRFKREICSEQGIIELLGEIDVVYDQAAYQKFLQR